MSKSPEPVDPRAQFAGAFGHLGAVRSYARRRGCADPDGVAAETMTIAWRRLADMPADDPLPWLYGIARNLAYAERRAVARETPVDPAAFEDRLPGRDEAPGVAGEVDPVLGRALASLSAADREALLLVAWEDLSPAQAARSLGISAVAFRVRLHRARKRCQALIEQMNPSTNPPGLPGKTTIEVEQR